MWPVPQYLFQLTLPLADFLGFWWLAWFVARACALPYLVGLFVGSAVSPSFSRLPLAVNICATVALAMLAVAVMQALGLI